MTAQRWFDFSSKVVIIKHGSEGSYGYTADGKKYKVGIFPVKLLKSFGGGDAYASAFLYGLMEGWNVADCLEFGSASAAILVSSHSCSDAMPAVQEVQDFMNKLKDEFGSMITEL